MRKEQLVFSTVWYVGNPWNTAGLGFNIRGGIDNHHVETDAGIFVTTVRVDGAAAKDGRLAPGDKILMVMFLLHHFTTVYCE